MYPFLLNNKKKSDESQVLLFEWLDILAINYSIIRELNAKQINLSGSYTKLQNTTTPRINGCMLHIIF